MAMSVFSFASKEPSSTKATAAVAAVMSRGSRKFLLMTLPSGRPTFVAASRLMASAALMISSAHMSPDFVAPSMESM